MKDQDRAWLRSAVAPRAAPPPPPPPPPPQAAAVVVAGLESLIQAIAEQSSAITKLAESRGASPPPEPRGVFGGGVEASEEAPEERPTMFDVTHDGDNIELIPAYGPGRGRPVSFELQKDRLGRTIRIKPIYD